MGEHGIADKLGTPDIAADAWVAPGAVLAGRVILRRGASVWYGCILRSDMEGAEIEIGEDSNIQDGAVIHVDVGLSCRVGARVTVGHGAILHACTVGDDAMIAMGATVLSGAKVGSGSIVAAGAVVPEGTEIPPGVIAAGVPAKVRREINDEDRARLDRAWKTYSALMLLHKSGTQYSFPNFRRG
ncbi:MAG TPA: gamma carbonic anhydrase family protein [Candidatus Aminicenantes bacterium]|nr:gamma carbonic anhydrase family protein [Candidatus Aminicenantes bacterium]HRY65716.1 gamma carbonic anhydrase family protein [Candidatus Aminicenantes bacterium]HRZ72630.1 gamma carbonic anhydrase family protein [Candidatus Aminicenantes bacterium]